MLIMCIVITIIIVIVFKVIPAMTPDEKYKLIIKKQQQWSFLPFRDPSIFQGVDIDTYHCNVAIRDCGNWRDAL